TLDDSFANGAVVDSADIIGPPLGPPGTPGTMIGGVVVATEGQDRLHIGDDGSVDVAFTHQTFNTQGDAAQTLGPKIGLAKFDSAGALVSKQSQQYPAPSAGYS